MNSKEMFSFSPSNSKSIALVKLSTEALQCIEEYAKKGASAGFKPTIQFKDGQGILSIPGMNNAESFSFSLSDVDCDGSQGGLQCIEKPSNGEMTCLGNIDTKMQIHAKNASIAHTKSRIEADDEKQKKTGSKVIKSACSTASTSSQAPGQTSQVEAPVPRERKKAVPLLKKLLSRNFLKGLRSGNSAVSRAVLNSAPQRSTVLLTEPPPIITSKEQKIVEMRKKRMLEEGAGGSFSDPRGKKQRIAHCSQTDLSTVDKANPNSCPTVSTVIQSETVTTPANKTQSQERKKRKRTSLDSEKDPASTNKDNAPIVHPISCVTSEKVVSVSADHRRCQETKSISLSNRNESSGSKVKRNEIPAVGMPSTSKSSCVISKPADKMSFQEAKDLRRKSKNRRKRIRQKQKKRDQKRAALMAAAASRIPRAREHQQPNNPILKTPAADLKTQERKEICKRINQPAVSIETQNSIELESQQVFTLDTSEPCEKKQKVEQNNQNEPSFVIEEKLSIKKQDVTSKLSCSNSQDPNLTQKELKHKEVEKEGNLPKKPTKSLNDFEASVLDVVPSKSVRNDQLPDLVQHCERIINLDCSKNKDCIIPSVTDEKMEIHLEDSETGTMPISLSSPKIPDIFQSSCKDSILCSSNHSFNKSRCISKCEVTSTSKRGQTPTQGQPIASTSNENNSAASMTSTSTKATISDVITELSFEEITTLEQRKVYKTVFDEKFEKYRSLQDDLSIYEKYLQSLAHTGKMYTKDSDDYKELKSKFHKSIDYHKKRMLEYAALHTQLERIKDLVMRFDSKL